MNTLLLQFIAEARDYLDEASRGLLALEQAGHDAELINSIFRNFHTLKGTSGIFPEFEPLTSLTHVAEDLMDQVRSGQRHLDTNLVDLLLGVLDQVGSWLVSIEATGQLPGSASTDGMQIKEHLLQLMHAGAEEGLSSCTAAVDQKTDEREGMLRSWLLEQPLEWPDALFDAVPEPVVFWYQPEDNCFFLGDDPVNLLRQLPAPLVLQIEVPPVPESMDAFDPYLCHASFKGVVCESIERIRTIFQYIPDQLFLLPLTRSLLVPPQEDDGGLILLAEQPEPELVKTEEIKLVAGADLHDHKKGAATSFIRVDQRLVNSFMDLMGELLVARNSLPYLSQRAATIYKNPELAAELDNKTDTISQIVESLQFVALEMRMMPVAKAFERFPRLVRDLSNKLGKKISLVMEGEETRADKDVIEALSEPLVHMVRNSLDHGIELPEERISAGKSPEGTICLKAFQDAGTIVVEITDDGKGIDPDRIRAKALEKGIVSAETLATMPDEEVIQLILAPDFSTADQISDLSGRGVGMDAVHAMVISFNGSVRVTSQLGKGSLVRLTLPLSMAITRLLTVKQGECTFGIPAAELLETMGNLPLSEITTIGTEPGLRVRGDLVPLYSLGRQLAMPDAHHWFPERFSVVVVRVRDETLALAVDTFSDITDAVMKPLTGMLALNPFYSGSTVLGDGSIMLLLNLAQVVSHASEH